MSEPENPNPDLLRNFSCKICFEQYNKQSNAPISLICGHTFCSACIRNLGTERKSALLCAICRKYTYLDHRRLCKNITLLDLLEHNGFLAKNDGAGDGTVGEEEPLWSWAADGRFVTADDMTQFYNQSLTAEHMIHQLLPRNAWPQLDAELEEIKQQVRNMESALANASQTFTQQNAKLESLFNSIHQRFLDENPSSSSDDNTFHTLSAFRLMFQFGDALDGIEDFRAPSSPVAVRWVSSEDEQEEMDPEIADIEDPAFQDAHFLKRTDDGRWLNCMLCGTNLEIRRSVICTHLNGTRHCRALNRYHREFGSLYGRYGRHLLDNHANTGNSLANNAAVGEGESNGISQGDWPENESNENYPPIPATSFVRPRRRRRNHRRQRRPFIPHEPIESNDFNNWGVAEQDTWASPESPDMWAQPEIESVETNHDNWGGVAIQEQGSWDCSQSPYCWPHCVEDELPQCTEEPVQIWPFGSDNFNDWGVNERVKADNRMAHPNSFLSQQDPWDCSRDSLLWDGAQPQREEKCAIEEEQNNDNSSSAAAQDTWRVGYRRTHPPIEEEWGVDESQMATSSARSGMEQQQMGDNGAGPSRPRQTKGSQGRTPRTFIKMKFANDTVSVPQQ